MARPVRGLFARFVSLFASPDVLPKPADQWLDPSLPVLYVLDRGGLADRATLAIAAAGHDLPDPDSPLALGDAAWRSSVEALEPPGAQRREARQAARIERLFVLAREGHATRLQIVPVAIYWGRAPGREDSFWRWVYADEWRIAGRLRKAMTVILHGRRTLVRFSEPIVLADFLATDPDGRPEPRKLLRLLRVHFHQRRLATLGPDRSHRRTLIGQVLRDPGVRRYITHDAGNSVRAHRRLERQSERYAYEIAADVSYPTVRLFNRLLQRLWNGLYDGVELGGFDRLRHAAEGSELVYVPCHRSHIDYLLLSWILYEQGYSLPHVAAGKNLDLPVVGNLLRRGGAFFLRRTFGGNRLYALVFAAYLKAILQRGHALEYFIEGGRSRTGRLLPPKGGMLAMTVQAWLDDRTRPVVFVPIYFGYERLLEGRAFTSELAGGKKQKETVWALLKSLRRLREHYGRVYVNVGEPIVLETLLDTHCNGWRTDQPSTERPLWLGTAVDALGATILQRINEAASVTPISLLASVLLATPRQTLGTEELGVQIDLYRRLLERCHGDSPVVIPSLEFDTVLEQGRTLGFVEFVDDALGRTVCVRSDRVGSFTYFRNNVIHLFVLPALIASAFRNTRRETESGLIELVQACWPYLAADFFLDGPLDAPAIVRVLDVMTALDLLRRDGDTYLRAPTGSAHAVALVRLAAMLAPVLERYYLTAVLLTQAGLDDADGLSTTRLDRLGARCAERLAVTHGRLRDDLHDRYTYRTFVAALRHEGLIRQEHDSLVPGSRLLAFRPTAERLLDEVIRHAIVSAAMAATDNDTEPTAA